MKFLVSVILFVALSGCTFATVNLQVEQSKLLSALPCCTSVSEFEFQPLNADMIEFDIDETSPAYEFASGLSYFKGLSIDGVSQVAMRSFYKGFGIDKSVVFRPILMELDENFETIAIIDNEFENSCDSQRGCFLVIDYRPSQGAAYVVIYTNPDYVGQIHKHEHTYYPGIYAPSGVQIGSGSEQVVRWDIPFSPIGDFELEPFFDATGPD